jgi:outer membrane biosynthesis protein TonB
MVSKGNSPDPGHSSDIQTIPPKVLRPYPASLPKELSATLPHDFDIAVKVHISNSGKVVSAEPMDAANGLEKSLSAAAIRAARYWMFTPANINGVPVASESVITFRFSPKAH